MQLFTRLAELQLAHEEQHVKRIEFEVTDNVCPVLSMENTVSAHVTVGATQNIVDIPTVQELVS